MRATIAGAELPTWNQSFQIMDYFRTTPASFYLKKLSLSFFIIIIFQFSLSFGRLFHTHLDSRVKLADFFRWEAAVKDWLICRMLADRMFLSTYENTPRQKSIRALEIFRVQKLILNATS